MIALLSAKGVYRYKAKYMNKQLILRLKSCRLRSNFSYKNWFNNKLRKIDINHKISIKLSLATWNKPYLKIIKWFMLALSLVHLSP